MGQSLLEVMNISKAYYHVSKEFIQVLFTPSLFCGVKEKPFKIRTKKINKYPSSTRARTMTVGHTVLVLNLFF